MSTAKKYEITLANPNAVYNLYQMIKERLAVPGVDKHHVVKTSYSLDYVGPSQRFADIIDQMLEDEGSEWRIHSVHVLIPNKAVKVLLRKHALVDLVQERKTLQEYELRLVGVLRKYAEQYNEPLIKDSSHIQIFRTSTGNFYYVLGRVFDQWEYNEDKPEEGWKSLDL